MDERKVLAEDGSVFAAVDVIRSVAPGQPVDVDQVGHAEQLYLRPRRVRRMYACSRSPRHVDHS